MTKPTKSAIKKAREAANLSQAKAAELIGYTRFAWCRWESGERPMRPQLFEMFKMKVGT